jgi:hypothetical protein
MACEIQRNEQPMEAVKAADLSKVFDDKMQSVYRRRGWTSDYSVTLR